ncbi:hypothetical protein L7F22_059347 [Adiantum nelumboides]|nr:hypothetical protein [Adiantum nelumboides]
MSAAPMLTRITYQALGMIEDLPAASSQVALIQQENYVPKAVKTTSSAASSRTARSIPSSPMTIPPAPPSSQITPFPLSSTPRTPPSPTTLDPPRSPPALASPQQQQPSAEPSKVTPSEDKPSDQSMNRTKEEDKQADTAKPRQFKCQQVVAKETGFQKERADRAYEEVANLRLALKLVTQESDTNAKDNENLLQDLIDLQSQLTRKEAQNHELIKNEKKLKEQLKYEDSRFQKITASYNTVKNTLTTLLQNQEPASTVASTSDSATLNTLAALQEELQTEKLQRQLLVSGFMSQTAQHEANVKELEQELAQAKAKLENQKQQIKAQNKGKEAMGSLASTSQISQAEIHLHIQQPPMTEMPDFPSTQEKEQQGPASRALDVREELEQRIEDMPEEPTKEYLLYERRVMESTGLAFLQPEEQVKDLGHDFLPLPMMRHEAILWKEKMRMNNIRPGALVIDKCMTSLLAINKVVNADQSCWEVDKDGTTQQVACTILICWFHTKKAWVEHLLPQAPKEMRETLYASMENLMQCGTEDNFEARYAQLLIECEGHPNIVRNFRLHEDLNLCLGLYYVDSRKHNIYGNDRLQTTILARGEEILRRYANDPSTIQVIDEAALLFKVLSMSSTGTWYQVSIQSAYCDCPYWFSNCKHLYGMRLILRGFFSNIGHILPIIDTARELVMEHNPEQFEDTTIDVEPTRDAHGQGPPPTQVLTQCIDELKALLHNIEEGRIPSYSDSKILSLVGQVRAAYVGLFAQRAPIEIYLPKKGSVTQVQAHVIATQLGHGQPRPEGVNMQIMMPTRPARQTGALRHKHQRAVSEFGLLHKGGFTVIIVAQRLSWWTKGSIHATLAMHCCL